MVPPSGRCLGDLRSCTPPKLPTYQSPPLLSGPLSTHQFKPSSQPELTSSFPIPPLRAPLAAASALTIRFVGPDSKTYSPLSLSFTLPRSPFLLPGLNFPFTHLCPSQALRGGGVSCRAATTRDGGGRPLHPFLGSFRVSLK